MQHPLSLILEACSTRLPYSKLQAVQSESYTRDALVGVTK